MPAKKAIPVTTDVVDTAVTQSTVEPPKPEPKKRGRPRKAPLNTPSDANQTDSTPASTTRQTTAAATRQTAAAIRQASAASSQPSSHTVKRPNGTTTTTNQTITIPISTVTTIPSGRAPSSNQSGKYDANAEITKLMQQPNVTAIFNKMGMTRDPAEIAKLNEQLQVIIQPAFQIINQRQADDLFNNQGIFKTNFM